MVFLCGRPGCGRESSSTLQIDAPSSTITLVDPRVSRDGVPLCPHHADATTPPLGWTMNDLRSQNRTLTPVPEIGPQTGEILTNSTSRRSRSRANPLFESSRPADEDEPSESDEVGRPALERPITSVGTTAEAREDRGAEPATFDSDAEPLPFPTSRGLRTRPSATRPVAEPAGGSDIAPLDDRIEARADIVSRRDSDEQAPASRPSKRREVAEGVEPEDDKFPWHHQFEDDEPEELQAKSPLLSRAFRSSVG